MNRCDDCGREADQFARVCEECQLSAEEDARFSLGQSARLKKAEIALDNARAELDKLRPVVEAARGLVAVGDKDSPWWIYDEFACSYCFEVVDWDQPGTVVEHSGDCPALALEQSLAALDAGEGE